MEVHALLRFSARWRHDRKRFAPDLAFRLFTVAIVDRQADTPDQLGRGFRVSAGLVTHVFQPRLAFPGALEVESELRLAVDARPLPRDSTSIGLVVEDWHV